MRQGRRESGLHFSFFMVGLVCWGCRDEVVVEVVGVAHPVFFFAFLEGMSVAACCVVLSLHLKSACLDEVFRLLQVLAAAPQLLQFCPPPHTHPCLASEGVGGWAVKEIC